MAEFVMKDLVKKAGVQGDYEIASAATSTEELGNPVYPPARKMLAQHGIDCAGKTARQIQKNDYAHYDLIVGMDEANMRNMHRMFGGDPDKKLHRLMEFSRTPTKNVADPWYTGDFEATWCDVLTGCSGILERYSR